MAKKLRKLCLMGCDKGSKTFRDFGISQCYNVSIYLQMGALFVFVAPIAALKSMSKLTCLHFRKISDNR